MNTPMNLMVIIREVRREVCLLSTGDLGYGGSEVGPHGPFHELPDQPCQDEYEPPGFDNAVGI